MCERVSEQPGEEGRRKSKREGMTYDIQPTTTLTIRDHLHRGFVSSLDVCALGDPDVGQAELAKSVLLEGAFERDVEVILSWVVGEGKEDLDHGFFVSHFQGDGEGGQ